MEETDEAFFQEFVVNLRWLCYYATHCLSRSIEARYPSLLDDAAALFDALPPSATNVFSLSLLPLGALQVATEGALYLLVSEAVLGSCPPTMHTFLDHVEQSRRQEGTASHTSARASASARTDGGSSLDTSLIGTLSADALSRSLPSNPNRHTPASQAMLLLHKWLVAEKVLAVDALADTLALTASDGRPSSSSRASTFSAEDQRAEVRRLAAQMATRLAQGSPFYLGAHVLVTRALLLRHDVAITTADDLHAHVRTLAGGGTWELLRDQAPFARRLHASSATIDHDVLLWVDGVLKCVEDEAEQEHQQQQQKQRQSPSSTSSPISLPSQQSPSRSRRHAPRTHTSAANPTIKPTLDYFRLRRHRGARSYPPATSLASNLRDGMDVCLLLHFYEPQLMPLSSVQILAPHDTTNNSDADTSRLATKDHVARALWNWGCALRVLGILGLWPGLTAEEVVYLGESVLPLHVLRILEEMFVLLATRAEESLRDSTDLEHEQSVFATGELPTSLSASTIPVEPYRASSPSGPTVLPPFTTRTGMSHGPFSAASSDTSSHVVTHTTSQLFPHTRLGERTTSTASTPLTDPTTTATTSSSSVHESFTAFSGSRLLASSVPEWDTSTDRTDGLDEDTQARAPIRPLVRKRSRVHAHGPDSSSRTGISTHRTARDDTASAPSTADTRLSWLDITEPVAVSLHEAAHIVTARATTTTAAAAVTAAEPAGGLVQSANTSISSVYAVSDDMTEDVERTVTSSAVKRSQPFTVTRTFAKPGEVAPAPPSVVLQSSANTSSSAQSLFEAARAPLPDGSPPFGVYSTPRRPERDSRSPSSDDEEESFDVVHVTAPPKASSVHDAESSVDTGDAFGVSTPPRYSLEDEKAQIDSAADSPVVAPPAAADQTFIPRVVVIPPTDVPPAHVSPKTRPKSSPLDDEAAHGPRLSQARSVSSSDFCFSQSLLVDGGDDDTRPMNAAVDSLQSTLSRRSSSGIQLAQFDSIASRNRTEEPGFAGDDDADGPSVTINIDEPEESSSARGLASSRSHVAAELPRYADPQDSVQSDVLNNVAGAAAAAASGASSTSQASSSSLASSRETSEFVPRRPSHTDATPTESAHMDDASPSPLGTPSAAARARRARVADTETEELSAQTPEMLSAVAAPLDQDASVDGSSTVYGSHAPSGVNDSWFSSVSRPGARQLASVPRVSDHAMLVEKVAEQQRLIEHLTSLLQRQPQRRSGGSPLWDTDSLGAQTVERAAGGRAPSSEATGVSGQLAASDVTTSLQRRFDDASECGDSQSRH